MKRIRDGAIGHRRERGSLVDMKGQDGDKVRPPFGRMIRSRHGQQCQPDPWRTRGNSVQWSLRLYLLPSAIPVQRVSATWRDLGHGPLLGNVYASADGQHGVLEPVVHAAKGKEGRLPAISDVAMPVAIRISDLPRHRPTERGLLAAEASAYALGFARPTRHSPGCHASGCSATSWPEDRGTRSCRVAAKAAATVASWSLMRRFHHHSSAPNPTMCGHRWRSIITVFTDGRTASRKAGSSPPSSIGTPSVMSQVPACQCRSATSFAALVSYDLGSS